MKHLGFPKVRNNLFGESCKSGLVGFSQSESDIKKMLSQFAEDSSGYGLKLHFGKTKIMTWNMLASGCSSVKVGWKDIDVLKDDEAEKHLGRKLCFKDSCEAEFRSRLAAGWGAFHKHKNELCSKPYRTCDRVKLFEAVVSSTILYGAATWALTQAMEKRLHATWRKMLRYVFRLHRQKETDDLEGWIDYMRSSATKVDQMAKDFGMSDWVALYRTRKYRFAGRVVRQTDKRWSKLAIDWVPNGGTGRSQGRPFTRWSDDLVRYAGEEWPAEALDASLWSAAEEGFVNALR